jgi:hypothetical protein
VTAGDIMPMEPGPVDPQTGSRKDIEPGTVGIIYATGGQYNIKPTDSLSFDDKWLMIAHNDAKNTKTMYSWSHVIWLRTWET